MTLFTPTIREIGGRTPQALWGLSQSERSMKGEAAAAALSSSVT